MSVAYIDTSYLLAVAFRQPGWRLLRRRLEAAERVYSSDLIVAEALATAVREGLDATALEPALQGVSLFFPDRSLAPEIRAVLSGGRVKGADLWHLACALYLSGSDRSGIAFLSRDAPQRRLARRLGFTAP